VSAAPDPTKEIEVSNSTGSPIVLMIPTTSTQETDGNGTMVYGQSLEVLTAVDSTSVIPDAGTKTFVLDQTYTDPKTGPTESTIYDLLPATADWYMPVADIVVLQSMTPPISYPAQSVTAADAKAFKDAATFVQTISAYPTSALATQYQQALGQAQTNATGSADGSPDSGAKTAQSLTDTVNQFFQGTKSFQDVTLEAVVAVQCYYGTFPFAWAEFATGTTTYYLYSSAGSVTSFVGTISLTSPATVDATQPNGGYTCTFAPATNGTDTTSVDVDTSAAKTLTYTDGLFVDDVNSDIPQVAVKGTFQIKSLFTSKPADTQIITVLTGSVTGLTCIGFDQPQKSSDPNATFWGTLFHPKTAAQIFQSIMTMGGALMMLAFAGQVLNGIRKWALEQYYGKEPATKDLLNDQFAKFQKSQQETLDKLVDKLSGGKESAPTTPEAAAELVQEQTSLVADSQAAASLRDGFQAQADNLEAIAAYEEDMTDEQLTDLQSLGTQCRTSVGAVDGADPANLHTVVNEQTTNLSDQSSSFDSLVNDLESDIGGSERAGIAANQEIVANAADDSTNSQDSDENLPKEDDPPVDASIDPVVFA
jgi:hypothetical protein